MKHILLLFFALTLLSCNKNLEQQVPPHSLSGDNAIYDESTAESALFGAYSYMNFHGNFDAAIIMDFGSMLNFCTQNPYTGDLNMNLPEFFITYESNYILTKWQSLYKIINSVNNLIFYVDKIPENKFGSGKKIQILAEAKFLRAFAYSLVMKYFTHFWDITSEYGPILRLSPSTTSNNSIDRSSVLEGYEQIFADLDECIKNGPDFITPFRGSKGSAKFLKTQILMMRGADGDYLLAKQLADQVINDYSFDLESTFSNVFSKGYSSKELIFSRSLSSVALASEESTQPSLKRMFGGQCKFTDTFFSIMNATIDNRYSQAFEYILFAPVDAVNKSLVMKKVWNVSGNCVMYYMRLAQMYLIKAEAAVYLGEPANDVLKIINDNLRTRSGNEPLDPLNYPDRQSLAEIVFKEYVREMCFENGEEWFVAIRMTNSTGQRLLSDFNPNYTDDNQLCFPLPKNEFDFNQLLKKQNP